MKKLIIFAVFATAAFGASADTEVIKLSCGKEITTVDETCFDETFTYEDYIQLLEETFCGGNS